jgi:outer membrane protein assembly factor BamB
VTVKGRGFAATEVVDLTFDAHLVTKATADPSGRFTKRLRVPQSALPGAHTLRATGESSGRTASAPFTVRTDWTKFHFDAANTGLNPYENVLDPSSVGGLGQAWMVPTPGDVQGAPAVASGVVYAGVGNVALAKAELYAIDADTGAVLWHRRSSGQSASDPTVSGGSVYMSTLGDSTLRAYDRETGAVQWSFVGAGGMGTPVVADNVLYVRGAYGVVYALDPSTGDEIWNTPVGGAIFAQVPAVADGIVYIGSSYEGKLYAFDAETGDVAWTADAGTYINSSAAVANGIVYVGSENDSLYAFDAKTGAPVWTAATGGNVDASPAVADGIVYAGSADHNMHAFDALTGEELWVASASDYMWSPIVANRVVYVGSSDHNVYAFDALTGEKLWSWTTAGIIGDPPAIADGHVYVGSLFDGSVYAFHLP